MIYHIQMQWRDADGEVRNNWSGFYEGVTPGAALDHATALVAGQARVSVAFLHQHSWWAISQCPATLEACVCQADALPMPQRTASGQHAV